MSRDAPAPPDPAAWQTQYLRLIAFPVEPQNSVSQNWWHDLTGADRESRVDKRREVEEEGVFQGLSLRLSIDLLRVTWTVTPRLSADNLPERPPTIGSFLERIEWFRALMHGWLNLSPPLSRLAFAGGLMLPVESREAGYELLNRYLRCVEVDLRCHDFLYRINRRVPSGTTVPNLVVNRLATWAVGMFTISLAVSLPGAPEGSEQTSRSERYACVLELDINTAPEPPNIVLPHTELAQILDELVALAADIAVNGDICP